MPKGLSLHIGLNKADPNHYKDMPELAAAVNDAVFWEGLAKKNNYRAKSLHDEQATADKVKETLCDYAGQLSAGDILLLTYAGHGGEMANDKPAGFDNERMDQTWCLYDRQLLDDELYECLEAFEKGVRITVVSDSCHSGTVTRVQELNLSQMLADGMNDSTKARGFVSRKLPPDTRDYINYKFGGTVYKPIQERYKTKFQSKDIKAAVKLMAACQDDQVTYDGANNGIFTEAFDELFKKPRL